MDDSRNIGDSEDALFNLWPYQGDEARDRSIEASRRPLTPLSAAIFR